MLQIAVLTISDSVANGTREDRSGAALRERVEALRWSVKTTHVVPDDTERIAGTLRSWAETGDLDVILSTGGTGISARDVTPEAVRMVIDKEIPGVGELMRSTGLKSTPLAPLSRSLAGSRGAVLILAFPGSPK
ncbi:MAG: MogA/MoaB family molybdenum cofactor biosynthesis protein, partial [Acidobacteriaceae bacterium]|nr:MogA/MoaB family molybdenum cofactor biosynthesis protein [Acidobacteriaceae bacterium]